MGVGQLKIESTSEASRCCVALSGELDLNGADALRAELDQALSNGAELTVIDLRDLRFVDSTGLSTLFEAVRKADEKGRRIAFTRSSPEVERTLELTGLDQILSSRPVDADS